MYCLETNWEPKNGEISLSLIQCVFLNQSLTINNADLPREVGSLLLFQAYNLLNCENHYEDQFFIWSKLVETKESGEKMFELMRLWKSSILGGRNLDQIRLHTVPVISDPREIDSPPSETIVRQFYVCRDAVLFPYQQKRHITISEWLPISLSVCIRLQFLTDFF